jgi:hypothetical protein
MAARGRKPSGRNNIVKTQLDDDEYMGLTMLQHFEDISTISEASRIAIRRYVRWYLAEHSNSPVVPKTTSFQVQ